METPIFVNGFTSWMVTYFQIATMMQLYLNENWDNPVKGEVHEMQSSCGSLSLAGLAQNWTNEFEERHEGETWEDCVIWFEVVEAFFDEKNNIQ